MPTSLIAAPALILAGVLVASAVGKLRHPDDLAGWAELGVPTAFRRNGCSACTRGASSPSVSRWRCSVGARLCSRRSSP